MSLAVPVSPVQSHSCDPPNQHMPPTPPPIVTSTDHHPLLLPDQHYPDARHYHQPPSDSTTTQHPTHSATPPSQQQPAFRAKDDVSSRFDFPLPPRAARQTHDAICRQADGNTDQHHNHNHNHNHEGSDNDGSHPRKPIDTLPTPPAVTASGSAAAAATVTITADTTTTVVDPSAEIDQLIASKTDDDYDIFVLKQATLYRRSKTSGVRGPGLVHRGIGLVKRDAAGGPICAGEIAASATPGSGRLKEDELAGRYGALPWLLFIRSVCHIPVALPPNQPTHPPPRLRYLHVPRLPSIHPSIHLQPYARVCVSVCVSVLIIV